MIAASWNFRQIFFSKCPLLSLTWTLTPIWGTTYLKLGPAVLLITFGGHNMQFKGAISIFVKMTIFDPCDPWMTSDIKTFDNFCSQLPNTACDQVWSKSDERCGSSSKLWERRKKERKKWQERNKLGCTPNLTRATVPFARARGKLGVWQGSLHLNFSSIGAFWELDLWPFYDPLMTLN